MSRSFQAVDMVPLPRLGVSDAIALGTKLTTWAKEAGKLPGSINRALARVSAELDALCDAAEGSMAAAGEDTGVSREADRVLDAAWAAAYWWCSGWARLPESNDLVDMATEIRDAVFVEGLRFTQLKFKVQWVESQSRLNLITKRGLDRNFKELGGASILDSIRSAHHYYGEVLGITEMAQDDTVSRRERLDGFLNAVRRYVIQITAYADEGGPGSGELADHLLAPLRTWQSPVATPPAGDSTEPDSPDAPVSGPGIRVTSPAEPDPDPSL